LLYLGFDVETSGLDYQKDKIWDIGFYSDNHVFTKRYKAFISKPIKKLSNLTSKDIQELRKQLFFSLKDTSNFLSDLKSRGYKLILVGHNIFFDLNMFYSNTGVHLSSLGIDIIFDTLYMIPSDYSGSTKLTVLSKHYNFSSSRYSNSFSHNALYDSEASLFLFKLF
jgi:DNA polymerase III alpha subunit (gram-positive type)